MQIKPEFRILSEQDVPLYRKIRLKCLQNYPDNFGTLYEDEIHAKNLKFDTILRQQNSQSFLLGAFVNQELIGICGCMREDRIKTNHRAEISQMYVRNSFAGQGIGTKLLAHTLDKAFADTSLEMIELGVVDNNPQAIKLYSNLGFVQFGQLDNYFKHKNQYCGFTFMVLTQEKYFSLL